jgi:hypothetical protein
MYYWFCIIVAFPDQLVWFILYLVNSQESVLFRSSTAGRNACSLMCRASWTHVHDMAYWWCLRHVHWMCVVLYWRRHFYDRWVHFYILNQFASRCFRSCYAAGRCSLMCKFLLDTRTWHSLWWCSCITFECVWFCIVSWHFRCVIVLL